MRDAVLLAAAFAALFGFVCPFRALAAEAPPPDVVRILSDLPGYYKAATPEQVRALIGNYSLAGLAAIKRQTPSSVDPAVRAITPLMRAALETPYGEVIDILVKAGCDVNAVTAPLSGDENPLGHKDGNSRCALHNAVRNPKPDALKALLRHKPDLRIKTGNRSCYTALELAAMRPECADRLKLLLEAGARPEPPRERYHSIWLGFLGHDGGDTGQDPFEWMSYVNGQRESSAGAAAKVKLLLDHGIKPRGAEGGQALTNALIGGQNEAARLLMDAGADLGYQKKSSQSPLRAALLRSDYAYYSNYKPVPNIDPDLIRRLVAHNDVNAAGEHQRTPLELACKAGVSSEVAKILVDAGAKYDTEGNKLMLLALESEFDCADLVEYLLKLGFNAFEGNPLRKTTNVPKKPRCAIALIRAGADPHELMELLDRDFAVKAGIIDRDGRILIKPETLSQAELQRREQHRKYILDTARKYPKDAVYWEPFYSIASPEEVREVIGKQSLSGVKKVKEKVKLHSSPGPAGGSAIMLPFLIFSKEFWTGHRTIVGEFTPLAEAARVTPHPEVVHMLVKAGCKVKDINSEAIHRALDNPNPKILEALLNYKANLEAPTFYLGTPLQVLAASDPMTFKKEHFRLLIAAGAKLEASYGQDSETPLIKAAYYRNTEAGRMLIAAGANVAHIDRIGRTPLSVAIDSEAWDLARDLLKAGAPVMGSKKQHNALLTAAGNGGVPQDLLLALLKGVHGDKQAQDQAVFDAAEKGHGDMVGILLRAGAGRDKHVLNSSMMASAAREERDDGVAVRLLLAHGADPNAVYKNGLTALHWAAGNLQPEVCAALLKAGANVDPLYDNMTPLHMLGGNRAVDRERWLPTAALLVAAGADVNREAHGVTALINFMQRTDAVAFLLKSGADPNQMTAAGHTPLTYAAADTLCAASIPHLLRAGADPAKPNGKGETPLAVALANNNGEAVAYIQAALNKAKRTRAK